MCTGRGVVSSVALPLVGIIVFRLAWLGVHLMCWRDESIVLALESTLYGYCKYRPFYHRKRHFYSIRQRAFC